MKVHSPLFVKFANEAKMQVTEIDVETLAQALQGETAPLLIDVREREEWQAGHIADAIHLSKGVLERDIEKQVPDCHTPMVLYCSGGYRSALAAYNLQRMGYQEVYSLKGGTSAWTAAGLDLIKPEA